MLDEQRVLEDPRFRDALQDVARQQQQDISQAHNYARKCLAELAVHPQDRYLDYVARLARFMYSRSYGAELDVNRDVLDGLKDLSGQHPMVFLWSHKSHLDSFVFMRALYDARFKPQPLSFAGINMNFAGFGALAKRSGAIFLRRSFHDDPIYKLVVQHYIDYLVGLRLPLSWSIEGTRSRTGMLMPPKLGLIQWVVEAYHRASCDDVLFVPVSISFDQIPEINDYIAMQRGLPKRKETLKWFIDYVAGMRTPYGKIYVRFAEPVALSDSVAVSDSLISDSPDGAQVRKLAFAVCNRIERAKPITATDLVSLVLLAANNRGMNIHQIHLHIRDILESVQRRGLPTAGDLKIRKPADLDATLTALTATHLLQCFDQGETAVYTVAPGRHLAAAYYRNTIVHYFLNSALAEVALASVEDEAVEPAFDKAALDLRNLFKFDFFFQTKTASRNEMLAFLDFRYPDWRSTGAACFAARPPMLGNGVLRSFIETYLILARVLVSRAGDSVPPTDGSLLNRACLKQGEEMLLQQRITTETALSKPLIANAIRLADYRGLLRGSSQKLIDDRAEFATEVVRAQHAVNRLQEHYDRGWQSLSGDGQC